MSADKTNTPDYLDSKTSKNNMLDYFNSSGNKEADKRVSEAITNRVHSESNDLFSGIGFFEETFLCVKEGSHLYQAPPRRITYVLQKPMKEELKAANYCYVRC